MKLQRVSCASVTREGPMSHKIVTRRTYQAETANPKTNCTNTSTYRNIASGRSCQKHSFFFKQRWTEIKRERVTDCFVCLSFERPSTERGTDSMVTFSLILCRNLFYFRSSLCIRHFVSGVDPVLESKVHEKRCTIKVLVMYRHSIPAID